MVRLLLKLLNAPGILLLACLAVGFQSSFFLTYPLNWLQPDILLVMVIWFALMREFTEGGVLTLLLGHLAEVHSSSPSGALLLSYMAVFLGVRLAARLLVIPEHRAWFRLTATATVVWRAVSLLVLAYLDQAGLQWRHTLMHLIPGAVSTALIGQWVYRFLEAYDHATFKSLRANQSLSDDLVLSESEGV